MTDHASASNLSVSQLYAALVKLDVDMWSRTSEQEMVAACIRCEGHKSPIFRVVYSAWFLFTFSGLVVYLWFLSHPVPWRAEGVTLYIMWGIFGMIVCTPLAGILRLLLVWLSEVGGLDRAAWVARQLKPLSIHSSAIPRVKNLVETCHECAAYQQQLMIRNRTLRLVDLGVMVYLSNKAAARKT